MPLSELELKWDGLCFESACEEMRRLKGDPKEEEKMVLYGLYKQGIHGDIPEQKIYPIPIEDEKLKKYNAWNSQKGKSEEICRKEYVELAEEMIRKYKRKIVRCKWNAEVWSVDY